MQRCVTVTMTQTALTHQLMTEASLEASSTASGLGSGRIIATTVAGGGNLPRGWLAVERTNRRRMGSGRRAAAAEYSCQAQHRHLAHGNPRQTTAGRAFSACGSAQIVAAESAGPSAAGFDGRTELKQHVHDGKQQPSGGTRQALSRRGATARHALVDNPIAFST